MKFKMKPHVVVEAIQVGQILRACAIGDIAALPTWVRENLESRNITLDPENHDWLYYNGKVEDRPRYTDASSFLIYGPLGYLYALSEGGFHATFEPVS